MYFTDYLNEGAMTDGAHLDGTDISIASVFVCTKADGFALAGRWLQTILPGLWGHSRQAKSPCRSAARRDRWKVSRIPVCPCPEGALPHMQWDESMRKAAGTMPQCDIPQVIR